MAEAPQQAHPPSHTPGEIDTHFESSPYDELAASRNGRQRCRFVDEYVITLVASEAVTTAGYKTRNPRQKGWELMRTPLVAAAIAQKMGERMDRTMITQDRVLNELAIVGCSSLDQYDIDPVTGSVDVVPGAAEHAVRAVSSIECTVTKDEDGTETRHTEIKLWDKLSALKLMAKHLGMLDARLTVECEVTHHQVWKIGDTEISF